MEYKAMALFGSSNKSIDPKYDELVFKTGQMLAENNITLIYGVGDTGLMGQAYQGVRSMQGRVLGVTIPSLLKKQCADPSIYGPGELQVVDTLEERKRIMINSADAILIAPGGWGTLDEIGTIGVRFKIGEYPVKPIIFLNYFGYWNCMKDFIARAYQEKMLPPFQEAFATFVDNPEDVFDAANRVYDRLHEFK
ncbi:MAG: TIGR00730 family Rossman fold protein [Alphaproteobacteria bacterium]|nr:TIGR00730 family Rossman fold protein [Alphaproteobacteria bacterium]